jgi:hypothetical protein
VHAAATIPAWSCLQHAAHDYDSSWFEDQLSIAFVQRRYGLALAALGAAMHCATHAARTTAAGGGAGAARTSCRCAIPACSRSAGCLVEMPQLRPGCPSLASSVAGTSRQSNSFPGCCLRCCCYCCQMLMPASRR